jgi:hypothetical protein
MLLLVSMSRETATLLDSLSRYWCWYWWYRTRREPPSADRLCRVPCVPRDAASRVAVLAAARATGLRQGHMDGRGRTAHRNAPPPAPRTCMHTRSGPATPALAPRSPRRSPCRAAGRLNFVFSFYIILLVLVATWYWYWRVTANWSTRTRW